MAKRKQKSERPEVLYFIVPDGENPEYGYMSQGLDDLEPGDMVLEYTFSRAGKVPGPVKPNVIWED